MPAAPFALSMWKFTGGQSSTTGIPARDLTDEEWAAIPSWLREIALTRGFYTNVSVTIPDVVEGTDTPTGDEVQPPLDRPALKRKAK